MGSPYNTAAEVGTVSAVQVGSCFAGQYYQVLQQRPDLLHQFYADSSSLLHVHEHTSSLSASSLLEIHKIITSLNFTAIEIKTINSLDSWNGGVLVVVSGCVKTKEFPSKRNFVQTFFLGPQDKGFFILNDIFQFIDDDDAIVYQQQQQQQQHSPPQAPPALSSENAYAQQSEDAFDAHLNDPAPLSEQPGMHV